MFAFIALEVLVRLFIVFPEFPDDVLANVAVVLLDFPCDLHVLLRWNIGEFTALAQQVEHELRDVATGDGDVLDGAPDHVALRAGDDVRNTVAGVDNGARERAVGDAVGGPGGGEGEHGLDGDVEALDVKGFEEDLSRLLAVLGRVEGRFGLEERSEDGRKKSGCTRTSRK